jgi:endonuclease/exonuclease/phosphatase family metal-dependent hydrolase
MFRCRAPSGAIVWVLANHFKSQIGGGGPKRARQAQEVRRLVDDLVAAGEPNIVVMGDLNEGPPALGQLPVNLTPLFDPAGPLVDAYTLQTFVTGPRPGTFQNGNIHNRLDYILVSRSLAQQVTHGGIERHGLWGTPTNVNPPHDYAIYPEITASKHSASDHAAIFVDVNI